MTCKLKLTEICVEYDVVGHDVADTVEVSGVAAAVAMHDKLGVGALQWYSNGVVAKLPSHWNCVDPMLGTRILTNSLAGFELVVPDRHPQGFVGKDESGTGNQK